MKDLAADSDEERPVAHASEDISSELSDFLGHLDQPATDSQDTKRSLLLGVSERTALLVNHRAYAIPDPGAYVMSESKMFFVRFTHRLTGPLNRTLNRIFPDDKPEDTMGTFSLVSTEIYLLICSCLPLLL